LPGGVGTNGASRGEKGREGKGREGKGREGKGRDELVHLEPILGLRFEMTEGFEWLGEASVTLQVLDLKSRKSTFWSIFISQPQKSVIIMNAGIQFGKTNKRKGVKSLLCNRYTICAEKWFKAYS
jgi:hypothetical protein